MFKIQLPNPWKMSIPEFFSQMRIVLKAAEKSYQDMVNGVELTDDNSPYISFRPHPDIDNLMGELNEKSKERLLETSEEEWQEISLEITRL